MTEEEQTEEIRGLIVALSSTNEDTFKYKGSTYVRDATTASTTEAPSLKKAVEKKFGQLTSPMVETTYSQNGNELTMNTTIYKTESNVYETVSEAKKRSDAVPEGGFKRNEMVVLGTTKTPDNRWLYGFPYGSYNSSHSRYHELMEMHPTVKEAVLKMQAAIDRTPFKGVIGVGIREAGSFIWVFRNHSSTRRFVNRVKAYSESYERLRKHLVPTQFIK